ncbi:MAG: FadR family transcriptional regulator [Rhodospirillaceae bacterium]|nr:FadR family transcriptional regulator [Rhodospirillaceae bacterium]
MIIAENRHRPMRVPGTRMGGARMGQEQVVRAMGLSILSGEYPEGALLPPEADLMARFGVSRTVLREVLKTLAAKGLVVSKTRVGTRVRPQVNWNMFDSDLLSWRVELGMDVRFLGSLYEIRLAVEPAAAALAALRRSDAQLARLRAIIEEFRRKDHTRASFAETDLAFHLEVAAASGNPFMRAVGAIIEAALVVTFADTAPVEDQARLHSTAEEHAAIVEAIAAGDATAAARAMTDVIETGRRNRTAALQSHLAAAQTT